MIFEIEINKFCTTTRWEHVHMQVSGTYGIPRDENATHISYEDVWEKNKRTINNLTWGSYPLVGPNQGIKLLSALSVKPYNMAYIISHLTGIDNYHFAKQVQSMSADS